MPAWKKFASLLENVCCEGDRSEAKKLRVAVGELRVSLRAQKASQG
jgi:hypothetical protein